MYHEIGTVTISFHQIPRPLPFRVFPDKRTYFRESTSNYGQHSFTVPGEKAAGP